MKNLCKTLKTKEIPTNILNNAFEGFYQSLISNPQIPKTEYIRFRNINFLSKDYKKVLNIYFINNPKDPQLNNARSYDFTLKLKDFIIKFKPYYYSHS